MERSDSLRKERYVGPTDGDEGRFNDVERELDELREQLGPHVDEASSSAVAAV